MLLEVIINIILYFLTTLTLIVSYLGIVHYFESTLLTSASMISQKSFVHYRLKMNML